MDMTTDFYSDNLLWLNVDALWTSWCLETQLQNHKGRAICPDPSLRSPEGILMHWACGKLLEFQKLGN